MLPHSDPWEQKKKAVASVVKTEQLLMQSMSVLKSVKLKDKDHGLPPTSAQKG